MDNQDEMELRRQIVSLAAQVEERRKNHLQEMESMGSLRNEWMARATKAEAELAALHSAARINHNESKQEVEHLKAELAALREGAKVTYRVEVFGVSNGIVHDAQILPTLQEAKCWAKLPEVKHIDSRIVEVITCERILDTAGGEG